MMLTITKSDTQIKEDVLSELKWDTRIDENEVGVQVCSGVVTLLGHVSSYPRRLAAREAAHRVHGVLDVVDDMQVTISPACKRTDEEITRSIREALRCDVLVPDERITAAVASGSVTLQGTVDTWAQKLDAERAVQRLAGVRALQNQIAVAPRPIDPERISDLITHALERQAEREAHRIGIIVRDGVVTLTGTVRSWGERNAIEQAAGHAPGVRQVDDHTTVDPYI